MLRDDRPTVILEQLRERAWTSSNAAKPGEYVMITIWNVSLNVINQILETPQ